MTSKFAFFSAILVMKNRSCPHYSHLYPLHKVSPRLTPYTAGQRIPSYLDITRQFKSFSTISIWKNILVRPLGTSNAIPYPWTYFPNSLSQPTLFWPIPFYHELEVTRSPTS